jgi:DNA polymerase III delta subunit
MKYNEALKEISFNKSKKFSLIGDEKYLKDQFKSYFISKHENASIMSYYPGDELDIKSSLYSSGLFEERLIVLNYFDLMKNKDMLDLIQQFEDFILLTFSDNVNLKSSIISSILSYTTPVQCNKMPEYGSDYPTWIINYASNKGYTFIDSSEDLLYLKVGPDLLTITNEFSKLMIYKKETKIIFPEDIEKVVVNSAVGSTFSILDNILRKDIVKTLSLIEYYLKNEEPMELVWFLGRYFEKLYRLLLLDQQKVNVEGIADIIGIPAFLIRSRYMSRSKSIGRSVLGKWLEGTVTLEAKMRTFKGDKKVLLNNFIISLVS